MRNPSTCECKGVYSTTNSQSSVLVNYSSILCVWIPEHRSSIEQSNSLPQSSWPNVQNEMFDLLCLSVTVVGYRHVNNIRICIETSKKISFSSINEQTLGWWQWAWIFYPWLQWFMRYMYGCHSYVWIVCKKAISICMHGLCMICTYICFWVLGRPDGMWSHAPIKNRRPQFTCP